MTNSDIDTIPPLTKDAIKKFRPSNYLFLDNQTAFRLHCLKDKRDELVNEYIRHGLETGELCYK